MTPQALQLQAPSFDELASAYDSTFTTSALGQRLRALAWERLDVVLAGCGRVLEIGCGTGEDAVRLARRGVDVLATDPVGVNAARGGGKGEAPGLRRAHRLSLRADGAPRRPARRRAVRWRVVELRRDQLRPATRCGRRGFCGAPRTRRAAGLGRHGTARSVGVGLVPGASQPG